uniref:Uncharacterized protein n=1 Tax=Arundo donax TaxID=35708 RepID=A0A0A9BCW2_ARUDO
MELLVVSVPYTKIRNLHKGVTSLPLD